MRGRGSNYEPLPDVTPDGQRPPAEQPTIAVGLQHRVPLHVMQYWQTNALLHPRGDTQSMLEAHGAPTSPRHTPLTHAWSTAHEPPEGHVGSSGSVHDNAQLPLGRPLPGVTQQDSLLSHPQKITVPHPLLNAPHTPAGQAGTQPDPDPVPEPVPVPELEADPDVELDSELDEDDVADEPELALDPELLVPHVAAQSPWSPAPTQQVGCSGSAAQSTLVVQVWCKSSGHFLSDVQAATFPPTVAQQISPSGQQVSPAAHVPLAGAESVHAPPPEPDALPELDPVLTSALRAASSPPSPAAVVKLVPPQWTTVAPATNAVIIETIQTPGLIGFFQSISTRLAGALAVASSERRWSRASLTTDGSRRRLPCKWLRRRR